jgi:hypothetical protein
MTKSPVSNSGFEVETVKPNFEHLQEVMLARDSGPDYVQDTVSRLESLNSRVAKGEKIPIAVIGSIGIAEEIVPPTGVMNVPYNTAMTFGYLANVVSTTQPEAWEYSNATRIDPDIMLKVELSNSNGFSSNTGWIYNILSPLRSSTPLLQRAEAIRLMSSGAEVSCSIDEATSHPETLSKQDKQALIRDSVGRDRGDIGLPLMIAYGSEAVREVFARLYEQETIAKIPGSDILAGAINIDIDPRDVARPSSGYEWSRSYYDLRKVAVSDYGGWVRRALWTAYADHNNIKTYDRGQMPIAGTPKVAEFVELSEDDLILANRRAASSLEIWKDEKVYENYKHISRKGLAKEVADEIITDMMALFGFDNPYGLEAQTTEEFETSELARRKRSKKISPRLIRAIRKRI